MVELKVDFSNTLSKSQIEEIATVDEFEVVKEVQVSCVVYRSYVRLADEDRNTLPTTSFSTHPTSASPQPH